MSQSVLFRQARPCVGTRASTGRIEQPEAQISQRPRGLSDKRARTQSRGTPNASFVVLPTGRRAVFTYRAILRSSVVTAILPNRAGTRSAVSRSMNWSLRLPRWPSRRARGLKIDSFSCPIETSSTSSLWSQLDRHSHSAGILRRTQKNPTGKDYNPRRFAIRDEFCGSAETKGRWVCNGRRGQKYRAEPRDTHRWFCRQAPGVTEPPKEIFSV